MAKPLSWNDRYKELKRYKKAHGSAVVSNSTHKALYDWLRYQQKNLKDKAKLKKLQKLGCIDKVTSCESRWLRCYVELKDEKKQVGEGEETTK